MTYRTYQSIGTKPNEHQSLKSNVRPLVADLFDEIHEILEPETEVRIEEIESTLHKVQRLDPVFAKLARQVHRWLLGSIRGSIRFFVPAPR